MSPGPAPAEALERAAAARAAAQCLDLSGARRLLYVGGAGELLAALLAQWPHLGGVWLAPAPGQARCADFLDQHRLEARMRLQVGQALTAVAAGELVVLDALPTPGQCPDMAHDWLAAAGPDWLPRGASLLILHRPPEAASALSCPDVLHDLGLRRASLWPLAGGAELVVCAPAHRFVEGLGERHRPFHPLLPPWSSRP